MPTDILCFGPTDDGKQKYFTIHSRICIHVYLSLYPVYVYQCILWKVLFNTLCDGFCIHKYSNVHEYTINSTFYFHFTDARLRPVQKRFLAASVFLWGCPRHKDWNWPLPFSTTVRFCLWRLPLKAKLFNE